VTGWSEPEVIGHPFDRFYSVEDRAANHPAEDLHRARLNRRLEERGWRLRKDGSLFWAESTITALHGEQGEARGFAHVMRDLTERKRMENLEEQGRHLTEFLAMLAHELRNPLAPIRSALAIMAAHRDLPQPVAWSRDVIERQTGQLVRLVDDLLDVSRITRGKLRMKSAAMDLNAAVQRAVEASGPLVEARRHTLEVAQSAGPLAVNGDMTRLTQVVVNILNNAAKYTPEGGRIELTTDVEGRDAVIRVRDNGVGIPAQLLERVFDVFAQGERTLDRSEGGLGIGLTLARRIVTLHGGTIVARSEGAGQGAEFEVRLPRLNLSLSADEGVRGHEVAQASRRRTVLVVDDNEDAANSLAMLLTMAGHTASIEHDGPGALERALRERPDIMLLDLGLPGMSGYEVAQALRARPEGGEMRIYALTGYGNEEDRRRSAAAGFDGHLVKPVVPSDLIALIEAATPAT
jgi:PAS domain S-box-containing protein